MSSSTNREATTLLRQSTEIALAAPQVVAHRMTRMTAGAGGMPSARDQKEFTQMVVEKQVAFGQAWVAMIMHAATTAPSLFLAMAQSWTMQGTPANKSLLTQWQNATLGMMNAGLAPVRAKAVANAKRLSRG
ncbi:polyhydroxyalkanoate granule-associated phasin [Ottowia thiooxydans]|uniref:polyhydroxyalkanoate granule-associated phasin n=1 Tax=Ottowia thiooxydans TaxID=219182 RepID=UPI00041FE06E|nr:polyhydroxyalkanoate granule-associated phasin [Ottowia thiooxydans]